MFNIFIWRTFEYSCYYLVSKLKKKKYQYTTSMLKWTYPPNISTYLLTYVFIYNLPTYQPNNHLPSFHYLILSTSYFHNYIDFFIKSNKVKKYWNIHFRNSKYQSGYKFSYKYFKQHLLIFYFGHKFKYCIVSFDQLIISHACNFLTIFVSTFQM
jgi:hypothetical protein